MYLGWNLIDHVGFGAIIDAAGRQHSKLKLINLRNNKISRCSSGNSRHPCLRVSVHRQRPTAAAIDLDSARTDA